MLRKKITAWVLTAAMLTGLGAAAPVTAFAQTAEDVTARIAVISMVMKCVRMMWRIRSMW